MRTVAGRVIVANYDPMALSDAERQALNERIRNNPQGFVYLDIRPGGPGGDMPVQGAIKLRSMLQILVFLAKGIRQSEEFPVDPDPRSGKVAVDPASTLRINVTSHRPDERSPSVYFHDQYYVLNDTYWDRTSFHMLNILFQTTVGDVKAVGVPITISK
jgi:hypothetical protein